MKQSSNSAILTVVRKRKTSAVPVRTLKALPVPFSATGIAAVLACPALLCVDLLSSSNILFGFLYLFMFIMLSSERRILIALFTTVATISLLVDLRIIYSHPGAELAVMDKIVALIALPLLATAFIYTRTQQLKARKRKPVCAISVVPPLTERIAFSGETNPVFRHMRRSNEPIDEYTRALIWFVYEKSPKN